MKGGKYKWSIGEQPPRIDQHSENKHEIYRGYIERYTRKFTQDPRHSMFKLFIVDGFCGGGVYTDSTNREYLGSPFIVVDAVEKRIAEARQNRNNPLNSDVHYYFVDKDRGAIDFLRKAHSEREVNKDNAHHITYLQGAFADKCQTIIADIKKHANRVQRAIFILDQYGWSKAPINVIRSIFSALSDAEIILTFTPDEIIDHVSEDEEKAVRMASGLANVGLDIEPDDIVRRAREDDPDGDSLYGRMLAREYIIDHIREHFPDKYFTSYYIKNENSHRVIVLVHLSQHSMAHNEMMEEHWQNSNINLNHQGFAGVPSVILGHNGEYRNQFSYFENDFFKEKEDLVQKVILEQVPRLIESEGEAITFGTLTNKIRNSAPITNNIMEEVMSELVNRKEIQVLHHETRKPRSRFSSGLHADSQIVLSSQKIFIF